MGETEVGDIRSLEIREVSLPVIVIVDTCPFDGKLNLLLAAQVVPLFCEAGLRVTLHVGDEAFDPLKLGFPAPEIVSQLLLVEVALLALLQQVRSDHLVLNAARPRGNVRRHQFKVI